MVTARLRAAGALILGKTNLSEWANFGRRTHQWLERARRPDPQSLRARSQSFRFKLGFRSGGLREFVRRRRWDGDGWIDHEPRFDQRHCRAQAHGRADRAARALSRFRPVRTRLARWAARSGMSRSC